MRADYTQRYQSVAAQREVERMEKRSQKANSGDNRAYRGAEDEEMPEGEPSKALYAYDRTFKDVKSFSSGQAPDAIEKAIVEYL